MIFIVSTFLLLNTACKQMDGTTDNNYEKSSLRLEINF